MVFLQNIWWYLVLIGVMILIHELGHYWAARFFDVKVDTFSFGFGPRLFGFRRGETDFRFSAILFGGYVKMAGEQPGDESSADPRGFMSKPRWQRLIIAFAGPAINIVLAVVLLTGLFMQHYPKVPTPNNPVVGYLVPDGAAAKAGIRDGDQVVQIDDKTSPNWEDIMMKEVASAHQPVQVWVMRNGDRIHFTVTPEEKQGLGSLGWAQETDVQIASIVSGMEAQKAGLEKGDILASVNGIPLRSISRLYEVERDTDGKPLNLVYVRGGQPHQITVTPVKRDPDGQGQHWMIGLTVEARVEITKLPLHEALYEATRRNIQFAQLIFKFLDGIAERRMSPKSIEGPIRIAQMSGEAAREGAASFFELMAGVSLNLAIFNLLPIPILDGGVMLMLLVEMLMRRDLDLKVKEAVLKVGIAFLMVVVVFVIYNDISKILPPQQEPATAPANPPGASR
ncbi:MAG: RIP metalloprotease RseP [Bryobacteraceae bacterium]|jgi:regulator of sigma E protease